MNMHPAVYDMPRTPTTTDTDVDWSRRKLFAFRAAFVYFGFYGGSWLLGRTPVVTRGLDLLFAVGVGRWIAAGGRAAPFGQWAILNLFHLPAHSSPDVRGDSLAEAINCLALIVLACAVGGIWSLIDRRRSRSDRLYAWLYAVVRLSLASAMFSYGWSKVLPQQFNGGRVPLNALVQPLGDMLPGQLLWSYMGFSRPYTIFAGGAELVGGLLICFRGTATAGALLLIAVLTNVLLVNMAYDVDVKVFAANLLLMAMFIAARDSRRLANFFLSGRATPAATPVAPLFASRRANEIGRIGAVILLIVLVVRPIANMLPDLRAVGGPWGPAPPLFGVFDATPATSQDLTTGISGWRRVIFENGAVFVYTDTTPIRFSVSIDSVAGTVDFQSRGQRTMRFAYRQVGDNLELRSLESDTIRVFRQRPPESFSLLGHKHAWTW
jgi:hypothetical protein